MTDPYADFAAAADAALGGGAAAPAASPAPANDYDAFAAAADRVAPAPAAERAVAPRAATPAPAGAPADGGPTLSSLITGHPAAAPAEPPSMLHRIGAALGIDRASREAYEAERARTNRLALHGATFGLSDELNGLFDFGVSKIPGVRDAVADLANNPSIANPSITWDQRAQGYRDQLAADHAAHPIGAAIDEGIGGLAPALIPGAKAAQVIGEGGGLLAGALHGFVAAAPQGFAQGVGDSEKLSKGDVPGAVQQGARTALIAGAAGAVLEPAIGAVTRRVGERQAKQVLGEIVEGSGMHGAATPTARKIVAGDREDIVREVMSDPKLAAAVRRPAAKALPVVRERIEAVGSQLGPHYDVVDKAAGGVRVGDYVDHLEAAARKLRATAGGKDAQVAEQLDKAAARVRNGESWGTVERTSFDPKMEVTPGVTAEQQIALMERAAKIPAQAAQARAEIERVRQAATTTTRAYDPDRIVPTRQLRANVTDLQSTAYDGLGGINGTNAYQKAREVAHVGEDFLRAHLDKAGDASPAASVAVDKIRSINPRYSALKNIERAIEQRGVKEAAGHKTLLAHGVHLLGGGEAVHQLLGGHVGRAAASLGAGVVAPMAIREGSHVANRAIAQLVNAARAGNVTAAVVQRAIEAGVPRLTALKLGRVGSEILDDQEGANAGP